MRELLDELVAPPRVLRLRICFAFALLRSG